MKTVCLNMIVKDERDVIIRCLSSVKEMIDYWVIVDTGSSDCTKELIREYLKEIPGELHERPWVDFGSNRNEALQLARGKSDYIFFIDADEVLVCSKPFDKNELDKPFYVVKSRGRDTEHYRIHLIDQDPEWKWEGVLHESVIHSHRMVGEILPHLWIDFSSMDGHRFSDPKKFLHDAEILEKALMQEPNNPRYVFFLAQSYFNAKEHALALKNFERRTMMVGEEGEMYISLYCIGDLQEKLNQDDATIVQSYLKAYHYQPARAEALERLGYFFLKKSWPFLTYLIAKFAQTIERPSEVNSHVIHRVYDYSLSLLVADSAYAMGLIDESLTIYHQLLANNKVPGSIKERIKTRRFRGEDAG